MKLVLAVLMLAAGAVFGQTAPESVAMPSIPPPNCVKPELPGRLASDTRRNLFNKEYKAYSDCVKQYVEAVRKLTDQGQTAANAVVDDFNAYTRNLQEQMGTK